ncbi:hypothetical protein [Nonomuraea sp. B19D2]|uniref:hypothetical protein n=1 Tax=Nonomuraea sp. B19D2 TaxID=3159561 RepID=UPI0032DA6D25
MDIATWREGPSWTAPGHLPDLSRLLADRRWRGFFSLGRVGPTVRARAVASDRKASMDETVLWQLARDQGLLPYRSFSRAFHETGKNRGYPGLSISSRQWKRWLRGEVQTAPYPQACDVLEHMFKRPIAELLARRPSSTSDGPPELGRAPRLPVRLLGATVDQPKGMYEMMMDAADQSREAAAEAELELGQAAMEQLEDDVVLLARTYLLRPPMEAFPDLVARRDQVRAMREETRRPDQLSDLYRLESVASILMAEACIDLGQTRHATDHARAAWSAAKNIGHVPLAVWARGMMATSAYWSGQPRDAVTAITRAEQHHPVGIAAARVHSIAARAWSHLGDKDKTVAAIRAAMEARAADRGGDDLQAIGGVFDWDPVREQRCFSSALLQLLQVRGQEFEPAAVRQFTSRILEHTRTALADARALPADQRSLMVEATIGIEMTTAFVILGDLLNARQTMNDVLELPANKRTFPVVHRLKGLHQQLVLTQQTQQAESLNSDVTTFMQASTVRALPPGS